MQIENQMMSRVNKTTKINNEESLSIELDFFFDNVMNTVVDYFKEEVTV